MKRAFSTDRSGLTLIELVAAMVLAAMMMVGLMNIVWSASRDLRQVDSDAASDFPTTLLIEQIRVDLQNARGMQWNAVSVMLHGFVSRDASTRLPLLTEGRVIYRVVATESGSALIREQNGQMRDVMWMGVGRILVDSLEQTDPEDSLAPLPEAGGLAAVPSKFRITLTDPRGRILWREVIHHHED
ncbi:MAG: hypothetical protein AAGG48_03260 [Planctomycetota bacterium]